MTDAPKRIWAFMPEIFNNMSVWQDAPSSANDTIEYLRADLVPRWSSDMEAAKKYEGPALFAWDDGRTLHARKNASGSIRHLAELPDHWLALPAPPRPAPRRKVMTYTLTADIGDMSRAEMTPCKFQTDEAGQTVLIYDETLSIYAIIKDPQMFSTIVDAVDVSPRMGKGYAMARLLENGMLEIGERLDDQGW